MKSGIIKLYNETSKYGFITVDGHYTNAEGFTTKDIFFHEKGLTYKAQIGDSVTFEIENGKKGFVSIDVKHKD